MELIPKEKLFRSENLVYDDEFVWTKLSWYNDILEIDRTTGLSRTIPLPKEYEKKVWAYRSINKLGRTIFVIPFRARVLLLLDLDTETYESIPLPELVFREEETEGFTQSAIIDDCLIMFGYYPLFLIFHISNREYEIVDGIKERFARDFNPSAWMNSWIEDDGKIYAHALASNIVIILDTSKKTVDTYSLNEFNRIDGVIGCGKGFFLSPIFGENEIILVEWDTIGKRNTHTISFAMNDSIRPFSWMAMIGRKVYMFSGTDSKSVCFDIDTDQSEEMVDIPACSYAKMKEKGTEFPLNYFSYVQMENHNYVYEDRLLISIHPWTEKLVVVDTYTNASKSVDIILDYHSTLRLSSEELRRRNLNKDYYLNKNEKDVIGGLEGFIAFLLRDEIVDEDE